MTTILCQAYFDGSTACYVIDDLIFKSTMTSGDEYVNEAGHKAIPLNPTPFVQTDSLPEGIPLTLEITVSCSDAERLKTSEVRDILVERILNGERLNGDPRLQVSQAPAVRN